MAGKRWTKEDVALLRQHAGNTATIDIARKMKRSVDSVETYAKRHGIKLACGKASEPPPPGGKTKHRKFDPADPAYRSATVAELRKRGMSLHELGEFLGVNDVSSQLMVDSLRAAGYHIQSDGGRYRLGALLAHTAPSRVSGHRFSGKDMAIGIIADAHLSSTKARLDALEMAYTEFKRQGVTDVYAVGNMIDGYSEYINGTEVYLRNVTDQCVYMADHLPARDGIVTHFITGDCHEGWYAKKIGLNVGHHMEDEARRHGRDDIKYIGHMEADVPLTRGKGTSIMRLFHPGGGSAYAQSYRAQKIVESYQGGEKPHILIVGHYHKLGFFYPRGVVCLLAGCLQDQSVFMRKKSIDAHVGFSILRIKLDKGGGIASVKPEIFPFYDREYHLRLGEWDSALYKALGG